MTTGGGAAAIQAGTLATVLAGAAVLVGAGCYFARPWLRTRDERASRDTARSQMSLLRTRGTSFQISDSPIETDAITGEDDVPGAGSMVDASSPIMCSGGPRARPPKRRWPSQLAIRRWRLWSLPRGAVTLLLAVELVAVLSTILLSVWRPINRESLEYFGAIVVLGLIAAESARSVERMRRWFSDTPHVNMTSVWTLAASLLTTPALAAATAVVLYAHLWARSWYQVGGVQPFRVLFNMCTVVLSCLSAGVVAGALHGGLSLAPTRIAGVLDIVLVIAVYSVVNSGLAAGALGLLRDQRSLRGLLGSWQENSIEYATLCVGIVTAALLVWRPWLVVLVLLPLYVLHRSVLIRQLEHAATIDEKTGVLNAETWHSLAATEFQRASRHGRSIGVLMADLDHFTQVNDRFGRVVGDQALRAVAEVIRQEARSGDLCGRLGGEEFAVLLPGTGVGNAFEVANRICDRIRALLVNGSSTGPAVRLSVSIGAAAFPAAGGDLEEVLLAADNALFAAKDAGRGRARAVHLGRV